MLDPIAFFSAHIKDFRPERARDNGWTMCTCPHHADTNASLSVNIKTGAWKCFGCQRRGSLKNFESGGSDILGAPPSYIEDHIAQEYHDMLLRADNILEFLRTKKGLDLDTIRKMQLGYDLKHVTIPVRDEFMRIVDIQLYSMDKRIKNKFKSYAAKYGQPRLFPMDAFEQHDRWIVLVEGMWDAILGRQIGLNAATIRGGAGTWHRDFAGYFENRKVVLLYDADDPGVRGASMVAQHLHKICDELRVAALPLRGDKDDKDISDYIIKHEKTVDDVRQILRDAKIYAPPEDISITIADEVFDVPLADVTCSENVHRRLRFPAHVAGKNPVNYQLPKIIRGYCARPGAQKKSCTFCKLMACGGEHVHEFEPWDDTLLDMLATRKAAVELKLRDALGVPQKCPVVVVEKVEYWSIEMICVIPPLRFTQDFLSGETYQMVSLYYLGHGLPGNKPYIMTGVAMPDPRTQEATALVYQVDHMQDSLDTFSLDESDVIELGSLFGVDGNGVPF